MLLPTCGDGEPEIWDAIKKSIHLYLLQHMLVGCDWQDTVASKRRMLCAALAHQTAYEAWSLTPGSASGLRDDSREGPGDSPPVAKCPPPRPLNVADVHLNTSASGSWLCTLTAAAWTTISI